MAQWRTDKPPNEVWVEVEMPDGLVIEAQAFYGRDGYRPHWVERDGSKWPASSFQCWREIAPATTSGDR